MKFARSLYKNREKILLWLFIPCFIVGLYALFIEPQRLRITSWNFQTEKLDAGIELKVLLLADFHMIKPWMTPKHVEKIVQQANQLDADYIFLLGDYVGTHVFGLQLNPEKALKPLEFLSAKCGVYAIIGNHDYQSPAPWPEAMENTGLAVLRNRAVKSTCKDRNFWIAGLEDLWWGGTDIPKTMEQIKDDDPVFMLMHNPDSFPDISEQVVASFAGHTHDGQIRFPIIGTVESVVPSIYGKRYAYGHVHEDNKDLFVTAGLGNSGMPLRLLNPPEIIMLNIKGSKQP